MKILFYEDIINPLKGGVQRVSWILATELKERGYSSYVVHFMEDKIDLSNSPFEDVLFFDRNMFELRDFLNKNQIDIVINQSIFAKINPFYELKNEFEYRLISVFHASPDFPLSTCMNKNFKKSPYQYIRKSIKYIYLKLYREDVKQLRKASEISDKIIVLSESFIPAILKQINILPEKVQAISNPLSFKYISCKVSEKRQIALVVSRMFDTQKRISLILEMWQKIEVQISDWQLVIVGDGEDLNRLKYYAKKLDLNNVVFEGYKDPNSYYKKSSIFLMASAYEGFGMTLTECLQYGVVPILFDTVPVFHDIIQDNINGFFVKEGNINGYINKTIELMNNKERRMQMSHNALYSVEKFSVKEIGSKWTSLFSQMCKEKNIV